MKGMLGEAIAYGVALGLTTAIYILCVQSCTRANASDAAVGDSIAVGTGAALRVRTYARSSKSSCWVLAHAPSGPFTHAVASMGINDPPGPCVGAVLDRVKSACMVVILPAPISSARANVMRQASVRGLHTLSYACKGSCSKRNFHPASYNLVAYNVRAIWSSCVRKP